MTNPISLSMIVKNSEDTLERALLPFCGKVQEIVLLDTGSTDRTIEIAEKLGAQVSRYEWNHDFGAARNKAMDLCRAPWILSLDSDEWVSEEDAQTIVELPATDQGDAYLFDTINYVSEEDDGTLPTEGDGRDIAPWYFTSVKVRLINRELPGKKPIRWRGAVHELLDLDARDQGYRMLLSEVLVKHDGLVGGLRGGYYEEICLKAHEAGEAHAGMLLVLGLEMIKKGDAESAERILRDAIKMEPGFASPYIWLAKVFHRTARSEEAITLIHEGLGHCVQSPLVGTLFAEAIRIHADLGERDCVEVMKTTAAQLAANSPHVANALKYATKLLKPSKKA